MGTIWRELPDAVRSLAMNPAFTVTVIVILALGIGANSTMFSVLKAVLLHPVPWENPQRLVSLSEVNPKQGGYLTGPSTANYKDWREQSQAFESIAAFRAVQFNLADTRTEPERVAGMRVAMEFFPLIGVSPMLGRTSCLRRNSRAVTMWWCSHGDCGAAGMARTPRLWAAPSPSKANRPS